jgi:hypothetical protein
MPRTCLACAHAERAAIDNALVAGQPFRDIAGRFSRLRAKAWELLKRAEDEGDTRGAVVALREARECLETLAGMLSGKNLDLASVSDDAILEEARRRGLNIHGQYVLTEREKREAEASLKTILAEDSESESPLLAMTLRR